MMIRHSVKELAINEEQCYAPMKYVVAIFILMIFWIFSD